MAVHLELGKKGEDLAVEYLCTRGFTILFRNWKYGRFEIDIIAIKDGMLHFVEVKLRSRAIHGDPEQNITRSKIKSLLKGIDGFKIASVSLAIMAIPAVIIMWQQNVFSIVRYDESARWSIAIACLLGIVGSAIATALYYVLIQRAGGLFASLVTYAIPVVAMFWGLIAHEHISVIQIACLVIILAGVYIASITPSAKKVL